jgi:hypothetical protein
VPRGVKPVKDDEAARHAEKIVAQSNIEDPEIRAVMENLIATSIRARDQKPAV